MKVNIKFDPPIEVEYEVAKRHVMGQIEAIDSVLENEVSEAKQYEVYKYIVLCLLDFDHEIALFLNHWCFEFLSMPDGSPVMDMSPSYIRNYKIEKGLVE